VSSILATDSITLITNSLLIVAFRARTSGRGRLLHLNQNTITVIDAQQIARMKRRVPNHPEQLEIPTGGADSRLPDAMNMNQRASALAHGSPDTAC
jgi:hypothetical protein